MSLSLSHSDSDSMRRARRRHLLGRPPRNRARGGGRSGSGAREKSARQLRPACAAGRATPAPSLPFPSLPFPERFEGIPSIGRDRSYPFLLRDGREGRRASDLGRNPGFEGIPSRIAAAVAHSSRRSGRPRGARIAVAAQPRPAPPSRSIDEIRARARRSRSVREEGRGAPLRGKNGVLPSRCAQRALRDMRSRDAKNGGEN